MSYTVPLGEFTRDPLVLLNSEAAPVVRLIYLLCVGIPAALTFGRMVL